MPEPLLGQSDSAPLFCDTAEEIRGVVEAYDAGFVSLHGYKSVSIDSLRRWADQMERAAVLIEGPAG
jgi:hypothetical protein